MAGQKQKAMRATITLTPQQQKDLNKHKKEEKNAKIYKRYLYVEMSMKGMTNLAIADLLDVSKDTLTQWKKIFDADGLEGLSILHYEGRRVSRLDACKEKIVEKIEHDNVATMSELQAFLKEECDITIENSWLTRYCKKNSIFLTKKHV